MMQPAGFREIANAMTQSDDGFAAVIPEQWRQGRTAYGGLTAGLALFAAQTQFPDLPPLRSAMVSFIGPVTESTRFVPSVLRQGKNVTSVSVDAICDGTIGARIAFVFGQSRSSDLDVPAPAETSDEAPDSYEPFMPEAIADFVPAFFHNFDTRLIAGARPVSGADEGYVHVWSRHKDEASRTGTDTLMTIGDVLPPAAMPLFKRPGAVSSVTWMINILTDDAQTQGGWWRLDSRISTAKDGYSSQSMGIWNTAGEKIAEGMQTVAIFI